MNPLRLARTSLLAATTLALVVGGASVASADSGAGLDPSPSTPTAAGSPGTQVASAPAEARSAARAAAAPINITKVNIGSFAVRQAKTSRPVVFSYKQTGSFASISIKANLYKGSKRIKSISFGSRTGAYFDFWKSYGRGGFRVDNFTITWTDASGTKHTAHDTTGGGFYAKSGIRGGLTGKKVIHMTHRGSKVSAKFRVMRYTNSGWRPYSTKVHFQITKNNHWKTRKTLRLNSKGVGTDHFVANRKHRYRITIPATPYTIGGRSKTVKV